MERFYEKYIKLDFLGEGGDAHVYKVKHAELGHIRALKVLKNYIENKNDKLYKTFLKECRILLAIGNGSHPNIVRIYGPDLIDNHAVVEMDYIQGMSLNAYIRQKGFVNYDEVQRFIHDIVGALAYTHHDIYKFLMNPDDDHLEINPNPGPEYIITPEKEAELVKTYGITHNDLHSNNVIRRDYDGRYILLDFGIAVQDGECVNTGHMGDGYPEYQAPEKIDSGTADPRSDVYSLGILIYELLAGRVPFQLECPAKGKPTNQSIRNVQNKHLKATPPPILPFRKAIFEELTPGAVYERDYPEWLDAVVMKCLAKNPEDRYSDAKELLDDINWHIAQEKAAHDSSYSGSNGRGNDGAGVDDSERPKPKRNKRSLLLITACCVALLAAVLYYILPFGKGQDNYIPVQEIIMPQSEYSLLEGDSISIIPKIVPADATDTIVRLTSSNPEIVFVKGNTIVALKSGDVILTASTKDAKLSANVLIKVTKPNKAPQDSLLQDGFSTPKVSPEPSPEPGHKPRPVPLPKPKPEQKQPKYNDNTTTIHLGYATWYGATRNGKPHGIGKLVFSQQHKVDRSSEVVANPGDYFEAVYENGQLINGVLFDDSGNKKKTIIP